MASRHLARSIAMQSLFEWDFNRLQKTAGTKIGKKEDLKEIVERNKKEFGPGLEEEYGFVDRLVDGAIGNLPKIDKIIEKAAPEWPINQITTVDRAVLRLGLYELLFGNREEVPPKVAIDEAIELAKSFGGESSGKFINGVLGTVYREIGEPGKEYPTKEELAKKREEEKGKEENKI
ncbi:MAG: transcription antitermination factor NusB [bacterium]|nr:transcription antitermination factor NusB [bacterium]